MCTVGMAGGTEVSGADVVSEKSDRMSGLSERSKLGFMWHWNTILHKVKICHVRM